MAISYSSMTRSQAYRTGAAALFLAIAAILSALGFEHIGGYIPCPLCLQQRWAYYLAIPMLFAALALVSAERPRLAAIVFFLVALAFLANAGLGVYQAGAEWKYWPGPDTCGGQQGLATNAGNMLEALKRTNVVRCDEAQLRIFGLSFAGWNAVLSLMLFAGAINAAFAAAERR